MLEKNGLYAQPIVFALRAPPIGTRHALKFCPALSHRRSRQRPTAQGSTTAIPHAVVTSTVFPLAPPFLAAPQACCLRCRRIRQHGQPLTHPAPAPKHQTGWQPERAPKRPPTPSGQLASRENRKFYQSFVDFVCCVAGLRQNRHRQRPWGDIPRRRLPWPGGQRALACRNGPTLNPASWSQGRNPRGQHLSGAKGPACGDAAPPRQTIATSRPQRPG